MSLLQRAWYAPRPGLSGRLLAAALAPASWLYRAGLRLRPAVGPQRCGVPVLSVGNLTVGGNGKTPLVIDLANRLARLGLRVGIVSRGYRRRGRGLVVAGGPGREPAPVRQVGDEPALAVRRCPQAWVVVGRDRVAASRLARAELGVEVIVADDAFQHRRLARDVDLVAIDARRGLGNGRLLPAGPLREPATALRRAGVVVLTYCPAADKPRLARQLGLREGIPLLACEFVPGGFTGGPGLEPAEPPPGSAFVFAGLAWPEGILASCRQAGVAVAGSRFWPDHHWWSETELQRLQEQARRCGAAWCLCSEKDLVRLERWPAGIPVLALRLQARWHDDPGQLLAGLCAGAGAGTGIAG